MSRRALVVGDGAVATGFANMNHAYVDGLRAAGWHVAMLALNYHGDPHGYPYPIYPCRGLRGGDYFGIQRLPEIAAKERPDVICVTQDPWNFRPYVQAAGDTPMIGSVAVDGKNCVGNRLNGLAHAVFWTRFGQEEAKLGGYQGPSSVIPLGVSLEDFYPVERDFARREMGLPAYIKNAFVVGVVGRNQPRKRIDLAMIYFAEWIKQFSRTDAYLYIHAAPTGDVGYDLRQMGKYLGISSRLIVAEPPVERGATISQLRNTYGCFDVMLSTTQGEGWGLCHLEGMACGVPQIVPDWSALGEWTQRHETHGDAAIRVKCTSVACTPNGINVVGGIMDQRSALIALDLVYRREKVREDLRAAGLALAARREFRWEDIGARFADAVDKALIVRHGLSKSDPSQVPAMMEGASGD